MSYVGGYRQSTDRHFRIGRFVSSPYEYAGYEHFLGYLRWSQVQRIVHTGRPARNPLSVEIVQDFVRRHQPDVIVFDVSFPYDHNWVRYREFRQADGVRDIPIVLTTTNAKALHDIVGATEALEVVGKPYDLNELGMVVKGVLSKLPFDVMEACRGTPWRDDTASDTRPLG